MRHSGEDEDELVEELSSLLGRRWEKQTLHTWPCGWTVCIAYEVIPRPKYHPHFVRQWRGCRSSECAMTQCTLPWTEVFETKSLDSTDSASSSMTSSIISSEMGTKLCSGFTPGSG